MEVRKTLAKRENFRNFDKGKCFARRRVERKVIVE
jgi:hypothetical protein